jgi:hypothetical protein
MNVTIEIPEDRAVRFQRKADEHGLPMDRWLLELAENAADSPSRKSESPTLEQVFAKVRGMAEDADFSRDPSPGRDVNL